MPARDEAATLPLLLRALAGQDATAAEVIVCLHLDGCRDDSRGMVEEWAARLPFPLRIGEGRRSAMPNAGAARAAAMDLGLRTLGASAGGALLSTDADSRPRPDWLRASLRALGEADLAAGRVVRASGADPQQDYLERYLDRLHVFRRRLDPVPWEAARTCHFSGGANLALQAGAYRALGGFRPLPHGEDATLLDDAARAGFRVRRDAAMVVETSSRRDGRATGGLAAMLRGLDAGMVPLVAHPAGAAWQYRGHAAARRAFDHGNDPAARARLGAMIGLDADHVLGVWRDCPNAEAFATRLVPAAPGAGLPVPLPDAERALGLLEREPELMSA